MHSGIHESSFFLSNFHASRTNFGAHHASRINPLPPSFLCGRLFPHTPHIKLNCGSFPFWDVTSQQIYDSFLSKKHPSDSPTKISDKYSDTIINWTKVYSLPFILHYIPNWENFNTKFWTLSLQMIKYFASAFHNLQIAPFAIKSQNQNIHTIPAIATSSCDSVRKDPFWTFSNFRWTFASFWPLPNGACSTFAWFWELTWSA